MRPGPSTERVASLQLRLYVLRREQILQLLRLETRYETDILG